MPSVNISPDYFGHPKTTRLSVRLGVGASEIPIRMWCYLMRYHPATGSFAGYEDQEIEAAIGCPDAQGKVLAALLYVGFLEKTEEGYIAHDWCQHNPHVSTWSERNRAAANSRWSRKRPTPDEVQCQIHAGAYAPALHSHMHLHESRIAPEKTAQCPTEQNRTEQSRTEQQQQNTAPAPSTPPVENPEPADAPPTATAAAAAVAAAVDLLISAEPKTDKAFARSALEPHGEAAEGVARQALRELRAFAETHQVTHRGKWLVGAIKTSGARFAEEAKAERDKAAQLTQERQRLDQDAEADRQHLQASAEALKLWQGLSDERRREIAVTVADRQFPDQGAMAPNKRRFIERQATTDSPGQAIIAWVIAHPKEVPR